MKTYVADFETTTLVDDCRVWAYAVVDVEEADNPDSVIIGTNITDFLKWCYEQKDNPKI